MFRVCVIFILFSIFFFQISKCFDKSIAPWKIHFNGTFQLRSNDENFVERVDNMDIQLNLFVTLQIFEAYFWWFFFFQMFHGFINKNVSWIDKIHMPMSIRFIVPVSIRYSIFAKKTINWLLNDKCAQEEPNYFNQQMNNHISTKIFSPFMI